MVAQDVALVADRMRVIIRDRLSMEWSGVDLFDPILLGACAQVVREFLTGSLTKEDVCSGSIPHRRGTITLEKKSSL